MKAITPVLTALAVLVWISSPSANASELVYSQVSDGQSVYGPSLVWPAYGLNSEVADEFDVVANIDRVVAGGSAYSHAANFQGVHVRFYEFGSDNKPGPLQREYFLAAGDPNVSFDTFGEISATLSPAFAATGRHFLSVQPIVDYWYWWSSSSGAPRGQAFYFRNNITGETWHQGDNLPHPVNADVVFSLYGTVTGAGVITSLSENTLPRSGYLEIFGTNFGADGSVLIGGINASVANWSSTRVVAYVPENAPLGSLPVQVVNGAGSSNTIPLSVTTRPAAAAHVNWRFRMDGPYSFVRPAIGSDGTVYSVDAFAHLYALTPDGGLKWLVRGAGDKGVAVGPDDTIYVASENYINAYHPDGSAKWHFVQDPRALTCLGVSVGPDGNIYSVATEGMGVFSLTPAGTLRWTNPEFYVRPIVDYGEIVFGPNGGNQQLYFHANHHVRALRLDGTPVFTLYGGGQPAIAPDSSVHFPLSAFSPDGNLLWNFQTPYPANVFTTPDIGSDGTHYFGQNLIQLFALNSNGSQRWHVTLASYVDAPIVDPLNTQLLMGSADTLDHAGFILSLSAQDAHELWRVVLPMEDGFNQFPNTRARFTADGQTAYFTTATATGDNNTSRSFVYSLDSGNGTPPPSPTPNQTPVATPTPINISGTVSYCSNSGSSAVPNVTLTVTGAASGSALTDGSGNYQFSLASGGMYTVTPTKAPLAPGASGINTLDVIATQRHFIMVGTPLSGCQLAAANVNGAGGVNTLDVIAIQRFYLGLTTGIANTGHYQFIAASTSYTPLVSNQPAQNYDTLVFGAVASGLVERAGGLSSAGEVPATVASIALPALGVDQLRAHSRVQSKTSLIAEVKTSAIDAKNKLVGFQGDISFDERVVTFQSEPVQKAGITGGNWNVSGNVLPGAGPIRTLRISAFSNDFTPLSGEGTLFELRMRTVSRASDSAIRNPHSPFPTPLSWATPPNQFIFIDADLNTQKPGNSVPGSVIESGSFLD